MQKKKKKKNCGEFLWLDSGYSSTDKPYPLQSPLMGKIVPRHRLPQYSLLLNKKYYQLFSCNTIYGNAIRL